MQLTYRKINYAHIKFRNLNLLFNRWFPAMIRSYFAEKDRVFTQTHKHSCIYAEPNLERALDTTMHFCPPFSISDPPPILIFTNLLHEIRT